jgi:hypothetical protein
LLRIGPDWIFDPSVSHPDAPTPWDRSNIRRRSTTARRGRRSRQPQSRRRRPRRKAISRRRRCHPAKPTLRPDRGCAACEIG